MKLEIDKSAVASLLTGKKGPQLDPSTEKFNFEILLRDKFPF